MVTLVERGFELVSRRRPKNQSSASVPRKAEAQAIAGAVALGVFARGRDSVGQTRLPGADFVTHPRIAVELDLGDRRRNFPLAGGGGGHVARKLAAHFLGFLVGDEAFLHEQVEQRPGILRARGNAADDQTGADGDQHEIIP